MPSDKSVRVPEKRDGLDGKRPVYPGRFDPEKERRKFGRTPSSVGCDKLLSTRDKVVYWALAYFERGGVARTGIRYMASACGLRTDGFCESLKALESRGHIEITRSSSGKRSSYVLLSPVFRTKQEHPASNREVAVGCGVGQRSSKAAADAEAGCSRIAHTQNLRPCLKCLKLCKPLKLTGWCRTCAKECRDERKMEHVARRVYREEVIAETA